MMVIIKKKERKRTATVISWNAIYINKNVQKFNFPIFATISSPTYSLHISYYSVP